MKRILIAGLAAAAVHRWRRHRPESLRGKIVIITGASAGIGRVTAHAFAAEGAHVVLVARRADVLDAVRAELDRYRVPVMTIAADVSRDDDLQRVVETVEGGWGRIDVLINNAGLSLGGPLEAIDPAQIRRLIDLNLYGLVRLTQLALPGMKARRYGRIVNVSSVSGMAVPPGFQVYGATKAAVDAFGQSLRRELIGTGVRVHTIRPSWTPTDMIHELNGDALAAARLILPPLMHMHEAETVARVIVDAVRRNHGEVIMGGPGFFAAGFSTLLAHNVVTAYFRAAGIRRVVNTLRGAGV